MNEQDMARFGPQLQKEKMQCFVLFTNRKLKQTFELQPSSNLSYCKYSNLMISSHFQTIYSHTEFETRTHLRFKQMVYGKKRLSQEMSKEEDVEVLERMILKSI